MEDGERAPASAADAANRRVRRVGTPPRRLLAAPPPSRGTWPTLPSRTGTRTRRVLRTPRAASPLAAAGEPPRAAPTKSWAAGGEPPPQLEATATLGGGHAQRRIAGAAEEERRLVALRRSARVEQVEQGAAPKPSRFIITPGNKWKTAWDLWMAALIIYSIVRRTPPPAPAPRRRLTADPLTHHRRCSCRCASRSARASASRR